MQAEEGCSLAEQKLRLKGEAAARRMHVVDIFPEEGADGKNNVYQAQACKENAVQMLRFVQDYFSDVSDHVKKEVYQELLDSVELFPEALLDGRL